VYVGIADPNLAHIIREKLMEKLGGAVAWVSIALALGAGCAMAVQPAVNARLAERCNHPLQASVISFATGLAALLFVGLVMQIGLPSADRLKTLPGWAWTGGLIGTYMVTVSLLVAPKLGATRWIALVLAGQIGLSLMLDHFGAGYLQHPLNAMRLLGVVCVAIGVWLVMTH
jgi:bacterial/archaeal transporter family-2 protein